MEIAFDAGWIAAVRRRTVGLIAFPLAAVLMSCATSPDRAGVDEHASDADQALFRVDTLIQDQWQELVLRGRTDYRVAVVDGRLAVRAEGRNSASGLIREVDLDIQRCRWLTWSWRVDVLQHDADLQVKQKEDVAASIFLLFGDPGFFVLPDPVPTLRYVWTNSNASVGTVVDSPYLPGVVRSLVVRSGEQHLGQWLTESRNVIDDFRTAFGRTPDADLHAVALFTDNDQTRQPVTAFYEWVALRCEDN